MFKNSKDINIKLKQGLEEGLRIIETSNNTADFVNGRELSEVYGKLMEKKREPQKPTSSFVGNSNNFLSLNN